MFPTETINNFTIKPVKAPNKSTENWHGKHIFPNRKFWNVALLSKTGSGKTTVIFNLIQKFIDKHTIFFLFSSTIKIDPTWQEIIKFIESKGNQYIAEPHFLHNGANYIDDFLHEYNKCYDDQYEPEVIPEVKQAPQPIYAPGFSFGSVPAIKQQEVKQSKAEKNKEKKMNFMIVLDDLSKDLRKSTTIEDLTKRCRHFHTRVIISSQSLNDINPSTHSQLYCLCLFHGMSESDLEYIAKRYSLWVPETKFKEIYDFVTKKNKYNFLSMLPFEEEFRKNLNERILVSQTDQNETA